MRRIKRFRAAVLAMLAGVVVSCGDGGTASVPVTALQFVEPPAELVAGEVFDLVVELRGDGGDRSTESGRRVSLALVGGQLSGPITVNADGGIARFKDLAITTAGEAFKLDALSGTLTASTPAFDVRVAQVSATRSSFFPDSIVFISGTSTPIQFTFTDAYGNPLRQVPVSLSSSLTGTSFAPSSGTTNSDGVFATTITATSTGKATLSANVGGTALTLARQLAATEFCAPMPLSVPGTVNGTLPIATCDAVGRPAAVYRFSKSGSGGVSFSAASTGFTARVEVKTSLTEASVALQPTVQIPNAEWLLPDGSYLYRISALSPTSSGSYSITATPISGTTGVTTRFLVAPGTYTGQALAVNDRDFGDGTVYDYFVVFSTRSCTITMRSTAFDAFLWIDDPVEIVNVSGNDNFPGGGTDARVVMNPCSHDGNPIGILANSNLGVNGSTPTGAYTLTIEFGPPAASLVSHAALPKALRPDTTRRDYSELIRMKRSAVRR